MIQQAMVSPFILSKIKITNWENRIYIQNLLLLYRLMHKQRLSAAEGQHFFLLRNKYKDEYLNLLKETDAVKYQVYLEEQERLSKFEADQKTLEQARQKLYLEEEKKEYEQWMALQKTA